MGLAAWLNTAWMLRCLPEARAFDRAVSRVAVTQEQLLRQTIRANRDTAFGRRHDFAAIGSVAEFQRRVPLSRYEDYLPDVARIAAGEQGVLTRDRVELLEPTSGTTAGEKWVPYTDGLRRQFQRAVAAWVADLFRRRPAVRRGRAYWSISPALSRHGRTAGGVRVGFDDDAAYLAGPERLALSRLLVVPPHLSRLPDLEAFRYATLLALLAAGDLALVSVWNPTFLSALFDRLGEWQDRLAADLAAGAVRCDRRRADHVRAVLRGPGPVCAKTAELWPGLALISCWADAAAARFVDEVRLLFPQVEVQPKGLLATEGCVSFPLAGRPAPVLALRSHFFEFEETAAPGRTPRLAHQLEEGGRYRVILTTAGGLYRYQLRDEVEAAGFLGRCPLLRFVGKADRVSDLVGEKLSEAHVRTVLDRALAGRSTRFVLLAPTQTRPPCYVLFLEGHGLDTEALADEVQAGLEENPHYRYAVALGQLGRLRVVILPADGPSAWGVYERVCLERGQKLGDIKPAVLDAWTGWADRFETAEPRS